ncbi:MAG: hypothetical protein AVDCRST_MAG66-2613 [uncultured Pseudonocardia sp.]|uniref:Uncharacterized protein n=1 Tax=uncultured Pseudonocardia sp. TaxID=211455 RepID=A0A6J4PV34_9PSEU|nr:MAG: hypothetical protein AVDCRST_MAG66-2613 [uncultured Pseudonocardia sp.]
MTVAASTSAGAVTAPTTSAVRVAAGSGGRGPVRRWRTWRCTAEPEPRNSVALYSPCATRWTTAAAYQPSPHAMTMKPIWATVECASAPLTSGRVSISTVP